MPNGQWVKVYELRGKEEFSFYIKPFSLHEGMYRVDFINSMLTKWDLRENFDQVFVFFILLQVYSST